MHRSCSQDIDVKHVKLLPVRRHPSEGAHKTPDTGVLIAEILLPKISLNPLPQFTFARNTALVEQTFTSFVGIRRSEQ